MPGRESPAHLGLKRLSLQWAQAQGFRIGAVEVSVPDLGNCRLDAAAYRAQWDRAHCPIVRRMVRMPRLGVTVVFECKGSRADFLKDSRSETEIAARLATLHERRLVYEEGMRRHFPDLRRGDGLFPEWEGYDFERAGWEPYDKLIAEIRTLGRRLHGQTKFARLARWQAANLHYVVAEPRVAKLHEIPRGWGLLVRAGGELEIAQDALWHDPPEQNRWNLLLRIAMNGTRAVQRGLGEWNDENRMTKDEGMTKAETRSGGVP